MIKNQKKAVEANIAEQELNYYRKLYKVNYSIADFTPTVCNLAGVRLPNVCGGIPSQEVLQCAETKLGGGTLEKMLIFCPDGIGEIHRKTKPRIFRSISKASDIRVLGASVMMSVTPVCFASIFSGTSPSIHGISNYRKAMVECETLFDVFPAAGINIALVAYNDCSLDLLFRKRKIDYYSLRSDIAIQEMTQLLLERRNYDVIICYMNDYDSCSHHTGVFSKESTAQLELAAKRYLDLIKLSDRCWCNYNRMVAFISDHGHHTVQDEKGIHGTHHDNIQEDMLVNHYFRFRAAEKD